MKVTIDIGKDEYIAFFEKDIKSNGDGTSWIGTFVDLHEDKTWIRFYEKDGLVKDLTHSQNITTPFGTLVERVQESFIITRESQVSDIEEDKELELPEEISPYDPSKIKVRRDILSIRELYKMEAEDKSIDLNPGFQRYFVWGNIEKSRFIESLILGLPIPLFYFAENSDITYNVIDGLQRLTTIFQFIRNEFPIKGLERLGKEYNGLYFKQDETKGIPAQKALPAPMVRRIEGTQLVINIIEASSPAQVKFDIFQRINSGGKHLNNQEIRNCIATATTRKYLHKMVHNDLFKDVTGGSVSDRRMDDQELALRFIGFWLVRKGRLTYSGNMTHFLNKLVDDLNLMKEPEVKPIIRAFEIGLNNCKHLFGKYAFRKSLPEHLQPGARLQSINKLLFTTWTVVLSERDIRNEIPAESFAYIQAKLLESKGEFYQNVTSRTNDVKVVNDIFDRVHAIYKAHNTAVAIPNL